MRRPRYETEEDLARERRVSAAFGRRFRLDMTKVGKGGYLAYDHVGKRDGVLKVRLEVKGAKKKDWGYFERLGYYTTHADKIDELIELTRKDGVPNVLAIETLDEDVHYVGFRTYPPAGSELIRSWGREDRGDDKDKKPSYRIPVYVFDRL